MRTFRKSKNGYKFALHPETLYPVKNSRTDFLVFRLNGHAAKQRGLTRREAYSKIVASHEPAD